MREILTGIFTWPWFSEPHGYNFNGHFIQHVSGNLCVDPVDPSDADLDEMARQGVARILITNRNHSRSANKIRARTGARTAMHPADAPHARKEGALLDDELNPSDKVGPFVVIDSPGSGFALAGAQNSAGWRCAGRRSAGNVQASAGQSSRRSGALSRQRAQPTRPRLRYLIGWRRCADSAIC